MKFTEIAALSGKGGLFKVINPTRTGVILESLDAVSYTHLTLPTILLV